ncbi:MFS transporter [Penicillium maclennaniae]|uniref:MFS transporter n=1 Tax=Penicillium maclennaniae TaxID=1343394 RepID=UPI00254248A9|nr:MFS transporter [Penicillium maclennaniae]KAJ5675239.1 MFS transporter [Penicillium maclennaniae]
MGRSSAQEKDTPPCAENVDHATQLPDISIDPNLISKDIQTFFDGYSGPRDWEPAEEAKLRHKIDRKLLSILCCTYALQYYDKAVLGQAAIFGLKEDLAINIGNRYSMSASIFYLGFICGAYPATFIAQKYNIRLVAGGICAIWGVCMTCTAAVFNYRGLYAQRFFLGLIEAGVPPIFMLLVGAWYTKTEQAYRMGIWYSCTGFISMFSPLVNYGIGHITDGALQPWQYMYIFAGGVTLLWSLVVAFLLPSDPFNANGFSDRERYIALARVRQNNAGVRDTTFRFDQLRETITDIRFLLVCVMAFLITIANGPVSSFAPIIINSFGFNPLNSLLLGMPAGFWGGLIELIGPFAAYKIPQSRTIIIVVVQLGVVAACLVLLLLPWTNRPGLLIGVYLLSSFGGSYAVLMGLQLANTAGYTKRVVVSSGIYIAYCVGNFIGPLIFAESTAPRYRPGFIITLVTACLAAAVSMWYRLNVQAENKRRDASGVSESYEQAFDNDLTDLTNPHFRYVL